MKDSTALLTGFILGTLLPEERREVREALKADPALRAALRSLQEDLTTLVPPAPPPAGGRSRLLAKLATASRFERFAPRVAERIGVDMRRARQMLRRATDDAAWTPWFDGGTTLHFFPGPLRPEADVGIVRVAAGTVFPDHVHTGEEWSMILEGCAVFDDGRRMLPGDEVLEPADSTHHFHAEAGGPDLMFFVEVESVDFFGLAMPEPTTIY